MSTRAILSPRRLAKLEAAFRGMLQAQQERLGASRTDNSKGTRVPAPPNQEQESMSTNPHDRTVKDVRICRIAEENSNGEYGTLDGSNPSTLETASRGAFLPSEQLHRGTEDGEA